MEAHQAPPSLGFSRQEQWSGLLFPSLEEISRLSHSIVFLYFSEFNIHIKTASSIVFPKHLFLNFPGVWLIYNVVLASGVYQGKSAVYVHIGIDIDTLLCVK